MIIANAKDSHEGDYLCQASNGIGSGKSKLVSLSVDGKKIMAMQELNTLNPNSIQYPNINIFNFVSALLKSEIYTFLFMI